MKLDYLYGSRGEDFRFYQLPALLLEAEEYKGLSAQAKILYSVLLSKVALSRKNGWIEEDTDRIYIICQQGEMMKLLGCSKPTVIKALRELTDIGLMEKKRRGQGRPDIICVKDFTSRPLLGSDTAREEMTVIYNLDDLVSEGEEASSSKVNDACDHKPNSFISRSKDSLPQEVKNVYFKKLNSFTSRSKEPLPQEVKDFDPRYIDMNYINNNYTDRDISYPSIYHNSMPEDIPGNIVAAEADGDSGKRDFHAVRETVRSRIDYPALIHDRQIDKDLIDSLVELIAGVLLSGKESVKIAGEYIPLFRVQERFRQLSMQHIQYVLFCMKETSTAIRDIHAYLLTALYQAPETIAFYYQQRVNNDLLDTS